MTEQTSLPQDTREIIKEILEQHAFLKDFGQKHLDYFDECASVSRFKPQQYLYRERDKADRLFLIHQGKVAIEIQAPAQQPWILMTVGAGEIIGWGWAFPPYRRPFSCRAVEDTVVIGLETQCLLAKCQEDYELGYRLMACCAQVLGDRLWASRLQLLSLLLKNGR